MTTQNATQPPNYNSLGQQDPKLQPDHHSHDGHDHGHTHGHDAPHLHRLHDPEGYPNEHSVWSGLPTWVLLLVEFLIGLTVIESLVFAIALFWIVAAVYFYKILSGHSWAQHILALLGFLVGLVVSPFVYLVLSVVGLVLWIVWIYQDIVAVVNDAKRPKLISQYFRGLFTYAN